MFLKLGGSILLLCLNIIQSQTKDLLEARKCLELNCQDFCEYGYVRDQGRCETCQCYDPCCNYPCPYGEECVVEELFCSRPPCQYKPTCVLCRAIRCGNSCPFGFKYNENGCQTCECIDPCENYQCAEGETCIAEPVGCSSSETCGVRFQCKKQCPELSCELYCPYGYKEDCGCPVCKCILPCSKTFCPYLHYCAVRHVHCLNEPCLEIEPYCRNLCDDREIIMDNESPINCMFDNTTCGENNICVRIEDLSYSLCCGPN